MTETVKEQLGPAESEQVTVVEPTGKEEPDEGEQVMVPPHWVPLSDGLGKVTRAPH